MADRSDIEQRIERLTVACRHLIDCIEAMFEVEGTGNLSRSAVGRAIAPRLELAKAALSDPRLTP